ncbi:hypothetical protein MARILYN_52 [Vibrio phage Marilyn]|nr:hypothetical protein MARILYN_52 [Vibrio phage Marilyn]WCD55575.1 hypothetical protein FAYDEN_52 [Vibrio phage Fayden]WCD55634.1 hypothetical protein BAYBAE_54 [Vibrio phage Baybae]WCD55691.1 hypothetical protein VAITEPHAGE_52 [Vibrio phage Vaitephage]
MQSISVAMIDDMDLNKVASDIAQALSSIKTLQATTGQAITHVSLDGNSMTFTHADTAKHVVTLPAPTATHPDPQLKNDITYLEQQMSNEGNDIFTIKQKQGELAHRIDSIESTYTYRGSGAPDYPDDARHSYFINSAGVNAREMILNLPDLNLPDGTTYVFNNENQLCKVRLQPVSGESIQNATQLEVPAQSMVMLVKSGKNWVKSYAGYLPSSLQDIINRVVSNIHGELHTGDEITAIINQWLSNPSTHGKLDQIIKSLGYEKKTQPPAHPDTIQIYIGKSDNYPSDFSSASGPFASHQKLVVQNLDASPSKVWIAVPETSAQKISGIVADGGLPATWDSKTITVDGKQWHVYLSPYQFHAQHIDFTLNWSI